MKKSVFGLNLIFLRRSFIFLSILFISQLLTSQNQKELATISKELLKEGWHRKEIDKVLQVYLQRNSRILGPNKNVYQPLPKANFDDDKDLEDFHKWIENYKLDYLAFSKKFPEAQKSTSIVAADDLIPNKNINRERGLWKHRKMYATSGRIYDLELHPENEKMMYANPDGDGIFKTTNGGLHWEAITDNIPDRLDRNSYENIIVDPLDFEHVFSISRYGNLYETKSAGKNWNKVINTNHKQGRAPQFKCVEAFRDVHNKLFLIGTVTKKSGINSGWDKGVYRSSDTGKHWTKLDLKEENLQEISFHKKNKNIIYVAGRSKLYKSVDAGNSFSIIKDFNFGDRPMFVSSLGGENAKALYVAISEKDTTRIYFSSDEGETWELRQDSKNKIGFEKGVFGGNGSSGWTSFFEVDPFDKDHLIASNVASCESFNGGKDWVVQSWSKRALAQMQDGSTVLAPHGSHNADNHVLKFHPKKKGLMVKGCDAGIMMKNKGANNWTNINGDMPAFLWYSVVVNEFGDRYLAGNTQDVNIQTNRYNKWENDRGYEGDAIFMNPSTNTTYYPVAKTEKGEGLNFLEPGFWKMHSWNYPKVAPNYKNLDQIYIAYGRRPIEKDPQLPKYLYVTQNRGVSFDRVPNMNDEEVFSVNVSREFISVLTAFTRKHVMASINEGKSWKINEYPENIVGRTRARKISGCVNPNNSQELWVAGSKGSVFYSNNGGENWTSIKGSLPNGDIQELLYHEGSGGDLYALVKGYGVFYKAKKDTDWSLWMDGFNLESFTEIRIDYPSQKMVASSYGRGLWEADLEKSVDRFFKNEIKIIHKERVWGNYVFQVESAIETPAYYKYTWTLNGKVVGNNSEILILNKLKKKDVLKIKMTSIYSSDVILESTYNGEYSKKRKHKHQVENGIALKDQFIDVGLVDLFGENQNFTFTSWVKPLSGGIVAANRRSFYRDAKGWYLEITKTGKLKFNAAFYQNRSLNKTFKGKLDQSFTAISDVPVVSFNEWTHVAVSVNRSGAIKLYVNGKNVGQEELKEIPASLSLNHVMNFTLMGDSYGKYALPGGIRNAAIYTKELSEKELKKAMNGNSKLKKRSSFYISFNKDDSKINEEIFKSSAIKIKNVVKEN